MILLLLACSGEEAPPPPAPTPPPPAEPAPPAVTVWKADNIDQLTPVAPTRETSVPRPIQIGRAHV